MLFDNLNLQMQVLIRGKYWHQYCLHSQQQLTLQTKHLATLLYLTQVVF